MNSRALIPSFNLGSERGLSLLERINHKFHKEHPVVSRWT
jgi:hypothetical protein